MGNLLVDSKVIYPELSYQIGGILFKVFKKLQSGYKEKHVQRAVADMMANEGLKFREQVLCEIVFNGKSIGYYKMDFIIEEKIVLEIKVAERFYQKDYDQVKNYLLKSNLRLGLLARFGRNSVVIRRILRPTK